MAKDVKIFIVTGILIDLADNTNISNELTCIVGYFTNLKELFKSFESSSIQSYSTVCSHIKKKGFYLSKGSRFWYRDEYEKFNEIVIRQVFSNRLYYARKNISLSELLSKEVSTIDIHLGMNLSHSKPFKIQ